MVNSLDVCAPLLDKEMLEFAATVPSAMKFKNGEKKHILKEAFKPMLPDGILYRKKMGFSVPLVSWFRHEIKDLAKLHLIDTAVGLKSIFDHDYIHELWSEHQSGSVDHGTVLWSMLMFEMWWVKYSLVGPEMSKKEQAA